MGGSKIVSNDPSTLELGLDLVVEAAAEKTRFCLFKEVVESSIDFWI
jgi:hypothetical protein